MVIRSNAGGIQRKTLRINRRRAELAKIFGVAVRRRRAGVVVLVVVGGLGKIVAKFTLTPVAGVGGNRG